MSDDNSSMLLTIKSCREKMREIRLNKQAIRRKMVNLRGNKRNDHKRKIFEADVEYYKVADRINAIRNARTSVPKKRKTAPKKKSALEIPAKEESPIKV